MGPNSLQQPSVASMAILDWGRWSHTGLATSGPRVRSVACWALWAWVGVLSTELSPGMLCLWASGFQKSRQQSGQTWSGPEGPREVDLRPAWPYSHPEAPASGDLGPSVHRTVGPRPGQAGWPGTHTESLPGLPTDFPECPHLGLNH